MAFTYFFRDYHTLELITEHVLPALKGRRYIRVWDAGCAHGPEPFSVAIIMREHMSRFLFRNVAISATDIDNSNQFGAIIQNAVYPEEEIKRLPAEILQKYFTRVQNNGHYRICDEIRQRLDFTPHDLLSLQPIRTDFSFIVCKNVLLHFTPEQRNNVFRMFNDSLYDGGFLITEQTQKLPEEVNHLFKPVTPNGQLFQKSEH